MKAKQLQDGEGTRVFALVFGHGEHVMEPLVRFLREHSVGGARLSGIGGFSAVTLGYFDWEQKEYQRHQLDEQVELLSLTGDVALDGDEPQVHAHVVVGRSDTTVRGGHLLDAIVRPTLELIVEDAPSHLRKRHDPETGLALIAPEL
ncbi:MAG: DNA-binding protein [Candidatus Dormibacteraeota bacterium]|nr:DNA-binding protein [Candidatus Dormibacteraeota bacterium]